MTVNKNLFVMSVDVDSWSSLLRFYLINHDPSEEDFQIEQGINNLLDLFSEFEVRATFFVPGEIVEEHSQTIKFLKQRGHEVACHGMTHEKNECLLPLNQQKASIKEATELLQKEVGCKPQGFRAPCLRSNRETVRILEHLGYVYDSSVLPSFIPGYYGHLTTLSKPYHPSLSSLRKKGKSKIMELPVSVNPVLHIPLSAAWMRNLGVEWVNIGVKTNFILGNPVVFYVHPRDVVSLPKIKGLPWHLYRNTGQTTLKMLSKVIGYAKNNGEVVTGIELAERAEEAA